MARSVSLTPPCGNLTNAALDDVVSATYLSRSGTYMLIVLNIYFNNFYRVTLCYSAVCTMALCLLVLVYLSVGLCLSQVGVLLKRLNGLSSFFAWRLRSNCPTLCYKEIRVTPKIKALHSGTLSKMLDFENFATAGRP